MSERAPDMLEFLLGPEGAADVTISVVFRMAVSFLCGALVGLEREWKGKPAGLRTNILICLGATLFTVGSELAAKYVAGAPHEATRITAQIVTGVGFLGAGAIMHSGRTGVMGLTTAATIWLVAAVGVIVGIGYPGVGILTATMTVLTLALLGRIEKRVMGPCVMKTLEIQLAPGKVLELARVESILESATWPTTKERIDRGPDGATVVFQYCARHPSHRSILWELGQVTDRRAGSGPGVQIDSGE